MILRQWCDTVSPQPARYYGYRHLITPAAGNNVDVLAATGLPIGADNGCYHELDERAFVRMLNRLRTIRSYHRRRPLWVAVPDKVGDHAETMALWRWYHHYVRGSDLRWPLSRRTAPRKGRYPGARSIAFVGGNIRVEDRAGRRRAHSQGMPWASGCTSAGSIPSPATGVSALPSTDRRGGFLDITTAYL